MNTQNINKEQERLLNMLNNQKITKEDYVVLLDAIDKKQSLTDKVFQFMINPFKKLAGMQALLIGMVIIFSTAFLALIAKVYIISPLGILFANGLKTKMPLTFGLLLYQSIVCWFGFALILYLTSLLFKQRGIRLIDFLGTVAIARFPYLIIMLLSIADRILNPAYLNYIPGEFHPSFSLISILYKIFLNLNLKMDKKSLFAPD